MTQKFKPVLSGPGTHTTGFNTFFTCNSTRVRLPKKYTYKSYFSMSLKHLNC